MYKMKGVNHDDDEELTMLWGEIPNVASAVNIQSRDASFIKLSPKLDSVALSEETMRENAESNDLTNYYGASQSQNPGVNDVSISPVPGSLISPNLVPSLYSCLNLKNVYNCITHKEDILDGLDNPVKKEFQGSNQTTDQEACSTRLTSNLSDDHSLTSAFANLSFKSGRNIDLNWESPTYNMGFPQSGFPVEAQYHHSTGKKADLAAVGGGFSHSLNRINFQNHPIPYTQGIVNEQSMVANREDHANVLKANVSNAGSNTLDEYLTILGRQNSFLPLSPRSMQLNSGIQAFHVPSSGPISGVEFPTTAYPQQRYLDAQGSQFFQPQKIGHLNSPSMQDVNSGRTLWKYADEDMHREMQQQFVHLQHLQNQGGITHNQLRPTSNGFVGSLLRNSSRACSHIPDSHTEHFGEPFYWNGNVIPQGLCQPSIIPLGTNLCTYYPQGSCSREVSYPFVHDNRHTEGSACSYPPSGFSLEKEAKRFFPEKILTRSQGLNSLKSLKPSSILANNVTPLGHENCNGRIFASGYCHHHPSMLSRGSLLLGIQNSERSLSDKSEWLSARSKHHLKCTSLDEIQGRIFALAKDQHGCRYLQDKCVNGTAGDVDKIFVEIIDNIIDLMKDPFGNYLVQKLLDVCNESQKTQLLSVITKNPGDLVEVCCDMHGTRSVQKVIDTLETPEEINMIISALKDGAVKLTMDLNGNHVIQRCLQCLNSKYNEFLFNAVVAHCVEIATHRHGCCVLQKCLQFSDGEPRQKLINKIAQNALLLSQDPFGNYVVQYVCEKLQWAAPSVIHHLKGHFVDLSRHKCGSNVVEKCLRSVTDETRAQIIEELMNYPLLDQILQDPFGNYVVQSALTSSKGEAVHTIFIDAIKPHIPALKNCPYGKRIISCVNSKSK